MADRRRKLKYKRTGKKMTKEDNKRREKRNVEKERIKRTTEMKKR